MQVSWRQAQSRRPLPPLRPPALLPTGLLCLPSTTTQLPRPSKTSPQSWLLVADQHHLWWPYQLAVQGLARPRHRPSTSSFQASSGLRPIGLPLQSWLPPTAAWQCALCSLDPSPLPAPSREGTWGATLGSADSRTSTSPASARAPAASHFCMPCLLRTEGHQDETSKQGFGLLLLPGTSVCPVEDRGGAR